MNKLKKVLSILVICTMIITSVFIVKSYAKTDVNVTDLAERGYNTVSGYSVSEVKDLKVLDETPGRQYHAQTLCTHKASSTDIGSYTAVRLIVDIDGDHAIATAVSSGTSYDLGHADVFAEVGFVAALADQAGHVGKVGVGDNDGANLYQLSYRYFYETGGFRNKLENGTGVDLVNDKTTGACNSLADQATDYAQNGARITVGNVQFIREEGGKTVSVGMTCKARILLTGAEYNQALNILTGTYDTTGVDIGVTKSILDTRYSEIGDEVDFKISVTNRSAQSVTMNLNDTYNTSHYEFNATHNSKGSRKFLGLCRLL